MALTIFKAFRSTVSPPDKRKITPYDEWEVDPVTGAIVGVQTATANGPSARFIPVDITLAQLGAPTAAMIADLDATFRINVPPYTRFQSDGAQLVAIGGSETETVIDNGMTFLMQSPLTVSTPDELIIQGGIKVLNLV